MYTDEDLYSAVKAGVLKEESVNSFRKYMEASRNTKSEDEENFRLISGFNDIFVVVASLLFLISSAWLSNLVSRPLGFLVVVILSWFLSVNFVLKRRLALPALLFLLAFVVGVFGFFIEILMQYEIDHGLILVVSCAATTAMIWAHWLKFKVPITVAAGVLCLLASIFSILIVTLFPATFDYVNVFVFSCGLVSFAIAMYWDSQDTERKSIKSDVAFWLHLSAAPLIVHPVFSILGVERGDASLGTIVFVVVMYVVLAVLSILIDRRALMASALIYVIYAFTKLFKSYGVISSGFAISGVFIGGALLFLSAFWYAARANLLKFFPAYIKAYLPKAK